MEHCDEGVRSTSNLGLRAVAASSMQFLRSSVAFRRFHLTLKAPATAAGAFTLFRISSAREKC
jgi:hypothetical protein